MAGASKNSRSAVATHKFFCPDCGGEIVMKTMYESGRLKNIAVHKNSPFYFTPGQKLAAAASELTPVIKLILYKTPAFFKNERLVFFCLRSIEYL